MFRRKRSIGCWLAAVLLTASAPRAEEVRPNILFILTDDQAAWAVGASGNPDAITPNLDRLFSQGAVLTNSFVVTPVCSPSRASLLTSRYGTELGITDWLNPRGGPYQRAEPDLGLDARLPTWVRQLNEAGYATGLIGKWHLGLKNEFHPTRFGYDQFIGFREGGRTPADPMLEVNGVETQFQGLTVDILTDHAMAFIREHASGRPFLLSLHYREPHAPWLPVADDDRAPYDGRAISIPNPDFPDLDIERVERSMKEYLASVRAIDRNVGRLLGLLDELGLARNTVVVFTSDHGYNIGHHGIIHKGNASWIRTANRGLREYDPSIARPNMFDTSIRVPTAVRWPDVIQPGTVITETIPNLDWYPTLLAMAGLGPQAGARIYGRNFLPLLKGERIPWDNDLYGEYSQHHYTEADLRMLRTPEWKLVRDMKNQGRDELYHLTVDPDETRNVIDDPEYAEIRRQLEGKLANVIQRLRPLSKND